MWEKFCDGTGNESGDKGKMSSNNSPIDGRKKVDFLNGIYVKDYDIHNGHWNSIWLRKHC